METLSGQSQEVASLMSHAADLLQRHRLNEAEKAFLEALQWLEDDKEERSLTIKAYLGLAQIYTKRGRHSRNDESEWHRYYLQALTMHRQALRLIDDETNSDISNACQQFLTVQDVYCQCLQTRLLPPPPFRPHLRPGACPLKPPKINSQWLHGLQTHIQNKLCAPKSTETLSRSFSSTESDMNPPLEGEMSKKAKFDFNRVRKAIQRMVKQVSNEVRSKYIRKNLSQETLKTAVSSELLCMLTPQNENIDVVSLFESYIIDETPEYDLPTSDVENMPANSSSTESDYSEEYSISSDTTTKNGGSARPSSLPTAASIPYYLYSPTESPQKSISIIRNGCELAHKSPKSPISKAAYGNRTAVRGYEPDFRLNGVLRIWHGHRDKVHHQHVFLPHKLHFEEMSPLTETCKYPFEVIKEKGEEHRALTEPKVNTTLAVILSNIADKLKDDNDLDHANELYTYSLGIFQSNEAHIPSHEGRNIAHLLKSLGAIRCQKGDLIGGSQLMEEAVEMYRRYHGSDENIDVVSVWYELGKAYVSEQCAEDSLYDYITASVKEQSDVSAENQDEAEDSVSDSDETDSSSGGESYSLNVHEAMGFLNHALQLLRSLRRKKLELHNDIYVGVLSKMADCCVMLGDYQKATLCYEEALILFRNITGSPCLALNAHVLCMLGVTNFLLRRYGKAVSMLETAHILQQHLYGYNHHFDMAFTLTMLGIINRVTCHQNKSIAWCMKAHDIYLALFSDLSTLSALKRWLIIENVYILGYSYHTLHLHERALHYLNLSHNMVTSSQTEQSRNTQQIVHILKLIADVYAEMDCPEDALDRYEEALQYALSLGDAKRSNTLQNQLFNSMAGVHVTTKNYSTAAHCLEQALDYQKNVQSSIKGDMFGMLHSLGLTYTLSGDIDKAIDCYKDAIEAYHEMHGGSPGPEIAGILGCIANLYHVKTCLEDDEEDMIQLSMLAEKYYKDACDLDPSSPVVIQFANFQYQQADTPDALLTMLSFLWSSSNTSGAEIVYNGPEQAVLPTHLQVDLDDVDEVILNAKVFGHFLSVLSYKELGMMQDGEDSLIELYKLVHKPQNSFAINFSMLGYALMEMDLMEEASEMFLHAYSLDSESSNSLANAWLCTLASVYKVLSNAVYNIWEQMYQPFDVTLISPSRTASVRRRSRAISRNYDAVEVEADDDVFLQPTTRDSGYYDSALESITWSTQMKSPTLETNIYTGSLSSVDRGYTSSENLQIRPVTPPTVAFHPASISEHHSEVTTENREGQAVSHNVLHSEISIDENSNISNESVQDHENNNGVSGQDEEWTVFEEETVEETPVEILKILREQSASQERDTVFKSEDTSSNSRKSHEVSTVRQERKQTEKRHLADTSEQSIPSKTPKEEIWYARNYLATPTREVKKKEEVSFKEVSTSNSPPQMLQLLKQQHPLDKTIQDLQSFAEVDMDISPEEVPQKKETWDSASGQWICEDKIDDLLKHSQDIENDIQESLRTIESHKKKEGNGVAVSGWRAATSARTQEILASIQNNNSLTTASSSQHIPSSNQGSFNQAAEVDKGSFSTQEDHSEPEEEQWQVWEEEVVVETPPEVLAAILAAQR